MIVGILYTLFTEHTTVYFKSCDIKYVLWLDNGERFPLQWAGKLNQMNFVALRGARLAVALAKDTWVTLMPSLTCVRHSEFGLNICNQIFL